MSRKFSDHCGFTLVELIIVIAIAAILLGLAVPSFSDLIKNNRMVTQINNLNSALSLARSEAIKRGVRVTVCNSANQSSCSGGWSNSNNGWIVFVDTNDDNDATDTGEEIIFTHGALSGGNTLDFDSAAKISYLQSGLGNTSGTFTLCDDRTPAVDFARGIIVNATGRIRVAVDDNDNGIIEDFAGNNVSCP